MSDSDQTSSQIQVLRDLGLSRAEAEVYLACLRLAAGGAGLLSSYRVAQDMGRDPANVGKTVNALAHLQAVRVVQEKPRLFVAVPPEEFTSHLLGRLRRRGAEAVTLLEDFGAPVADGVAQALSGRGQVLGRAQAMCAVCKHELLVAGSPELVRELGADLELAAERSGCRVRVVSPQAFSSAVVEVAALPTAGWLGEHPDEDWLVVTGDDQHWLVALLPQVRGEREGPCGWWCSGSPVARVWADYLEQCWRAGVRVGIEVEIAQDFPVGVPTGAPVGTVTPEVAPATAQGHVPVVDQPASAPHLPTHHDGESSSASDSQVIFEPVVVRPTAPRPAPDWSAPPTLPAPAATVVPVPPEDPDGTSPLGRPLSADEADKAGFSFLFKHDREPGPPRR